MNNNSCNQCSAMMIQGIYCHETGCPNTHKIKIDGEWISNNNNNNDDDDDCYLDDKDGYPDEF